MFRCYVNRPSVCCGNSFSQAFRSSSKHAFCLLPTLTNFLQWWCALTLLRQLVFVNVDCASDSLAFFLVVTSCSHGDGLGIKRSAAVLVVRPCRTGSAALPYRTSRTTLGFNTVQRMVRDGVPVRYGFNFLVFHNEYGLTVPYYGPYPTEIGTLWEVSVGYGVRYVCHLVHAY